MEQSLVNLFGYAMDNWFICFGILGVAVSAHIKRDRTIILLVTLCSIAGHFASPYFYDMAEAWKYWGVFGATVGFIKLALVILLIKINALYRTKLAEWLSFIFIFQVGFHGLNHIDYAVLRTDYLAVPLFSIEILGDTIEYNAYKMIVQSLNAVALLSIYGNWFLKLLNHGENNGDCQSDSDSSSFHARVRSV